MSLNEDGEGWRVRFDVGGSQYGGHGENPLAAFRAAADLARGALSGRGLRLDIDNIERTASRARSRRHGNSDTDAAFSPRCTWYHALVSQAGCH